MALLFDEMPCAICKQPLSRSARRVATSHFIADESDPLWGFSDTAMHYECFQKWEHREEFVDKYNSSLGEVVWGNGTRHHMKADGVIESVPAHGT